MFSIIIPLYNKQNVIKATLDSVLCQTFSEFEVIVVDDGSTDDSFIRAKETVDRRIRIIQKPNEGVCSARNRGIIEAKYNYIAFLDADDVWQENYLEEQLNLVNDFPKAAMWGINFALLIDGKVTELDTRLTKGFRGIVEDYFSMNRHSDLFCSSSVVIKKKVFEIAGVFDTRIKYSEDLDMWYRVILNYPVVFYDRIMVYYKQDTENRAMTKRPKLKCFLPYYIDKYYKYDTNKVFYTFINRWSAIFIRQYYFNIKEERKDALDAAMRLDYSVLPIKYKYMFKTPYFIGKTVYYITSFKQKLFK